MVSTGEISADLVLNDKTDTGLASAATKMRAAETSLASAGTKAGAAYSNALAASIKNSTSAIQASLTSSLGQAAGLALSGGFMGAALTGGASAALTSVGTNAAQTFATFDDQMRKVQAVTSATDEQFKQLTATAKELGATTSFTAQESAGAMTLLGQAGFNTNEILAAMPATLNLARGSMTDLTTTADIMSSIMRGFQIPAQNTAYAADVLAMAANRTNTDITGLGEAMKYVAPLAYDMGWSLEETAAYAGMLSDAGIKGSMAGTVLRNSIARLLSPTKEVQGIFEKYGITLAEISPETHTFSQILDVLSASGMSTGEMMTVFGMRAGPGTKALLNQGTGAIRDMIAELQNSEGYASSAASAMDAGFGGALREANNALEAMQLSLGQAVSTVATPLLFAFSAIGKTVAALPQPIMVAVAAIGALSAAGLGVLSIISIAGLMLPGLITGLTALGVVEAGATLTTSGLATAIWAALAPITAVVVGAGLLVAGLYVLEKETGVLSAAWQYFSDIFTILAPAFSTILSAMYRSAVDFVGGIARLLYSIIPEGWVEAVTGAIEKVTNAFSDHTKKVHEEAEKVRTNSDKVNESLVGWGKYDPSKTVSNISMVDSMISQTGTDALTATGGIESMMNVDPGVTIEGITGINSGLQDTINYGENVYDVLSKTGSVSVDELNSGLATTAEAEREATDAGSEMFYIVSEGGNISMDGTNSQLSLLKDNGEMVTLTFNDCLDILSKTGNWSSGQLTGQLMLVDSAGKAVNLTEQQLYSLLTQAGNWDGSRLIGQWNNVRGSIQGAIGDAYKFIEVNNEVASSISKIGAAYKTTADQVGNLSGLAGKWNLRETPGTVKSSGGNGTGEDRVKVKDPQGLYSNSTTNVKVGTINNNGTSTSANNLKKAGVA